MEYLEKPLKGFLNEFLKDSSGIACFGKIFGRIPGETIVENHIRNSGEISKRFLLQNSQKETPGGNSDNISRGIPEMFRNVEEFLQKYTKQNTEYRKLLMHP